MKISWSWLKEMLPLQISADQAEEILTQTGLEVSSVETYENFKGGLQGFVIGEVVGLEKHPNADKLKCTKINIGTSEPLSVVCGAPNVALGQKVVLATQGTKIYTSAEEFFTIQKSKLRGEPSEGMLCSENEIGLSKDNSGIMIMPATSQAGTPLAEIFPVYSDQVLEVELTANRGDAASHWGVARDIYAALYAQKDLNLSFPKTVDLSKLSGENPISVQIEAPDACPRYAGLYFKNIQVQESPAWLKNRLASIGLRAINNVVDITNYVLHETGQPLHAFDGQKIKDGTIHVKHFAEGTPFTTLDSQERKLQAKDLVIANAQEPMCLAGVFGGLHSGVSEQTTEIFLESACFNGRVIRKTSKHHLLFTDASFRFERDTDINMVPTALARAAYLLQEICGAQIQGSMIDVYPQKREPNSVLFRKSALNKLLGHEIPTSVVEEILIRLGFELEKHENAWKCTVPLNKTDVTREIDIIEEVARIYGLNNIPMPAHLSVSIGNQSEADFQEHWKEKTSTWLTAQGFSEAMNNSLMPKHLSEKFQAEKSLVEILNPLSQDLNILRTSMLYGLLQNAAHNIHRNQKNVRLYEFGYVYEKGLQEEKLALLFTELPTTHWKYGLSKPDLFTLKGPCEELLAWFKITPDQLQWTTSADPDALYAYKVQAKIQDQVLLDLGLVSAELAAVYDLSQEVFVAQMNWPLLWRHHTQKPLKYVAVNKFPQVTRDLALFVPQEVGFEELKKTAILSASQFLQSVDIFDVYQGKNVPEGKKSYALRFVLENKEETFKEEQIEKTMQIITQALFEKHQAVLRS